MKFRTAVAFASGGAAIYLTGIAVALSTSGDKYSALVLIGIAGGLAISLILLYPKESADGRKKEAKKEAKEAKEAKELEEEDRKRKAEYGKSLTECDGCGRYIPRDKLTRVTKDIHYCDRCLLGGVGTERLQDAQY